MGDSLSHFANLLYPIIPFWYVTAEFGRAMVCILANVRYGSTVSNQIEVLSVPRFTSLQVDHTSWTTKNIKSSRAIYFLYYLTPGPACAKNLKWR